MIVLVLSSNRFSDQMSDDEEIDSEGSDIEAREDVGYESEEDHETAEEKRLRLAKIYLQVHFYIIRYTR